jgi:hypothetical protein
MTSSEGRKSLIVVKECEGICSKTAKVEKINSVKYTKSFASINVTVIKSNQTVS